MCLLACYVVTCSLLRLDVQIDVNSILKECRRAYKVLFILKVYVFLKPLEPVDLTWFKLHLKKNKQTNKSKRQLAVSRVGYGLKYTEKTGKSKKKMELDPRRRFTDTKTKESGNKQKNKTKQNKTLA